MSTLTSSAAITHSLLCCHLLLTLGNCMIC